MRKRKEQVATPKTIGQYAEEQYRKDPVFRKAYDEEIARLQLGYRIAQLRKQRKITQGELARRVQTTQQTISRIEDVKNTRINMRTLIRVASALRAQLRIDLVPDELVA